MSAARRALLAAWPAARTAAWAAIGAVAASVTVAATANAAATTNMTVAAESAAAPRIAAPAEVAVRRNGEMQELTDAHGFTLYTYVKDGEPNKSTCADECARNWPPLQAPAGAQPIGAFGIVQRTDGGTQWSYRGQPLYRYAADEYPGATYGDGLRNLWRVANVPLVTPPGVATGLTRHGRVLVDEKGHTLYTLRGATAGKAPDCDAKCLGAFLPLKAAELARPVGDWTLVKAADGTPQWAYKGAPLYRFRDDRRPGDTHGADSKDSRFIAMIVQPPSPAPAWARYANADMGIVYARADGRTVYTFRGNRTDLVRRVCDETCIAKHWQPFAADSQIAPTGDWSVKAGDNGRLQWAYRGALLYVYTEDSRPGDTLGDNFGASWGIDGPWKPILRWQY